MHPCVIIFLFVMAILFTNDIFTQVEKNSKERRKNRAGCHAAPRRSWPRHAARHAPARVWCRGALGRTRGTVRRQSRGRPRRGGERDVLERTDDRHRHPDDTARAAHAPCQRFAAATSRPGARVARAGPSARSSPPARWACPISTIAASSASWRSGSSK